MSHSVLIIPPLIERHIGDAAFYWAQHDRSVHSPLISLDELHRFDRLLDAHLDGIRGAGHAGWQLAQHALQRWNSAGEVFVCAVLAFEGHDAHRQAEVIAAVQRDPQRLLRGLVSAIVWLPPTQSRQWLHKWLQADQTVLLQTTAWRIAAAEPALLAEEMHAHALWLQALEHPAEPLRAAACRAAWHRPQTEQALQRALLDEAMAVRAEAAIALQRKGQSQGRQPLRQAVEQLNAQAATATGFYKKQALHRLRRWVRYLALALPVNAAEVEALLEALPPRLMLEFILHHGNAALLPWVQEQMHNPECARMAGWVWSCLTGIDLQANGLMIWQDIQDVSRDYPTDALDPGLPMPNAHAIASFSVRLAPAQTRPSLLGKPIEEIDALHAWHNAPQALRWIVMQRKQAAYWNSRAHGRAQRLQLVEAMA